MFRFIIVVLLALSASAAMADLTRFRGENGAGHFAGEGLMKSWPEGGPPLAWMADGLGQGYASPIQVGDTIHVPGMTDDQVGHIFMLSAEGAPLGRITYGPETLDGQAPGSRSTPTFDGNRLYILSGLGTVYCINLDTRETLWAVNILERFQSKNITWSLAESLWIDGDRVICTPGGPNGVVAALDKMTGETVWATTGLDDLASYCSPVIVNHGGRRLLLTETAKFVIGVDADSGQLLWKHEHITDYDIHAVTPVYDKGLVYFTGGYGSGGGLLELSEDGASVRLKWEDRKLDCQHHGVVLLDGYLYGTGHKNAQLMCLEMATGKQVWSTREVRQGVVIYADGMLYLYEGPRAGVVSLVKATPEGFERTGRFTVTAGDGNHWAHPIIVNERLLLRRGNVLLAYTLKP